MTLLNPIATFIESTTRSKDSGNQGDKSNKLKHDYKNYRLNSNSFQLQSGKPHVDDKKLRCWFCRDSHKTSDCAADGRRELVNKNNLCFNCLSSDHMTSQCRSKHSYKVSGCSKGHHTLLHREMLTKNSITLTRNDGNTQTLNVSTLLQIVPVIIKNGNESVKSNTLLDSGTDIALINKDLASKLNLSEDSKVLNICNAISQVSKVECKPAEFQISSVCNSFKKSDINAYVVNKINVQPNSSKISPLKND